MNRSPWLVAALLLSLGAAGCASDAPAEPLGTAEGEPVDDRTLPPPKLLLSKNQTADDVSTSRAPFVTEATVEPGFDELLVGLAVSGAGTYSLLVTDENGTELESTGERVTGDAPDSHTTTQEPTAYTVAPGVFTVTVDWKGAVTFTLTITERNHEWTHLHGDHSH